MSLNDLMHIYFTLETVRDFKKKISAIKTFDIKLFGFEYNMPENEPFI